MGEAKSAIEILSRIARRMGYAMNYRGPAQVMDEIATLVPSYAGINYARLERQGVHVPARSYMDAGTPILTVRHNGAGELAPRLASAAVIADTI
ncbi:MAG: hypothetical protein H0T18_03240 [Chloroflexia bacterium]|nr:hypothetical protein [Chloroflexia bacterium]